MESSQTQPSGPTRDGSRGHEPAEDLGNPARAGTRGESAGSADGRGLLAAERVGGLLHPALAGALAVLVLATWFVQYLHPIMDGDTWHQMAYGRYMLENRTTTVDHTSFCWTPTSGDFIYCAWIAEIVIHLLYKIGETTILFFFRYLCQLPFLLAMILYARARGALTNPMTWLVVVLGVLMSVNSAYVKPNMFSHVFMTFIVCVWIYLKHAKNRSAYACYLFPIAMLIWANTHGGFIFGAFFLFVMALGEEINSVFSPQTALPLRVRKHLLFALFLSAATVFMTPYGLEYPVYLFRDLASKEYSSITAAVREYDSIFAPHQQGFHFVDFLKAAALLLLGLLASQVILRLFGRRGESGQTNGPPILREGWLLVLVNIAFGAIGLQYLVNARFAHYFFGALSILFVGLVGYLMWVGLRRSRERLGHADWDAVLEIDWAILFVNVAVGVIFAKYLRTTFFWAPVFALSAIHLISQLPRGLWFRGRNWNIGISVAISVICLFLGGRLMYERLTKPMWAAWPGFGISYLHPVEEAEFIRENLGQYKVGNDYNVGGYLMWRLAPEIPTFIDGRMYPFRKWWPPYRAFETGMKVQEFIQDKRFNADLWCMNYYHPRTITWFINSRDWTPVFYDISSAVFVRKDISLPAALEKRGTRIADIRNLNQGLLVLQFAMNIRDWEGAEIILDSMDGNLRTGKGREAIAGARSFLAGIKAYHAKDYPVAVDNLWAAWENKNIFNKAILVIACQQVALQKWKAEEDLEALKFAVKGLRVLPDELVSLYNSGAAEWYLTVQKGVTLPDEDELVGVTKDQTKRKGGLLARLTAWWVGAQVDGAGTGEGEPDAPAEAGNGTPDDSKSDSAEADEGPEIPRWEKRLKLFLAKSKKAKQIPEQARVIAGAIVRGEYSARPPLIKPQ